MLPTVPAVLCYTVLITLPGGADVDRPPETCGKKNVLWRCAVDGYAL